MVKLIDLKNIYSNGRHNAFTDIPNWNGYFYVSFRIAEGRSIIPNDDIVIIRSKSLGTWILCSKINSVGDDRDPKLVIWDRGLGIVFGIGNHFVLCE